jgi:uncharacterized protein YbaP (TraB family)
MRKSIFVIFFVIPTILLGQKTILWKVTNPNTKNISYLLGTYHLFGESFVDSLPLIKEKIQGSNFVITETKIDKVKSSAYYNSRPVSTALSDNLPKEDVDFITNIFKQRPGQIDVSKYTAGELFVKLQSLYPTYKCSVINKKNKLAMDEYIQQLGNQSQKQLYYFETDTLQLELFTKAVSAYDWKFFKKNIHALLDKYKKEIPDENLCTLANEYSSFEIDYKFEEPCAVSNSKNATEILLNKRNEEWMQTLLPFLEKNSCFIAVGLLHLKTQCGIIEKLKARGYKIEPITLN